MDSDGEAGPSPTQTLLLSLAGCMGVDVRMILEKSRVPVESLEIDVEGDRVENPPRRFRSLRLTYRLRGPGDGDQGKLERAVELSREKYCSVLHTLRPDLDLDVRIERA
jgi:putative redox protein